MRRFPAILLCALCMTRLSTAFCISDDTKSKLKTVAKDGTTAGAIGVTGWGGSDLMQGVAEKSADADAEQDMRAYLATFRCDYGQGRNIMGGETGVQLPNASQLSGLKAEYTSLATELKATKAALNMRPGIESELIIDSATAGLYDDVSTEIKTGAFTSLSRALLDENSQDAKEWAAQKSKSQNKIKSGAIKAAAGVAMGVAGNFINTNSGNNSGNNSNGKSGILGLFGNSNGTGVASARGGTTGTSGNGGTTTAAPGSPEEQIQRAENAHNALQSDISVQADSAYSQLLAVKQAAEDEELEAPEITNSASGAETAQRNIKNAISAAADAVDKAHAVVLPERESCDAEKPTEPKKSDYPEKCDDDDDECETYADAMKSYNDDKKTYDEEIKECEKKEKEYKSKLDDAVKNIKRHADEAVRQERIGRTELGKIQTALSTAQSAKDRAATTKKKTEEKEAAEQKANEAKRSQISAQADLATRAADDANKYYLSARNLATDADSLAILDDSEADAETQIKTLKANIKEDVERAKAAADAASEQIENASGADSVQTATTAVNAAQRQVTIAKSAMESIKGTLQKIKDAKAAAKKAYEAQQAAEEGAEEGEAAAAAEDSEEENVETEE